jgi:hypothetical protein
LHIFLLIIQIRTSRGGQAPNKGRKKASRRKSTLPFRQFVIRLDGKVSLCSNDAFGLYTMGDVSKNILREILGSSNFQRFRKEMLVNP